MGLFDKVLMVFVVSLVLLILVVWMPVHVYGEIKCLEQGYPNIKTTVTLDNYCVKTFGDSTIVEKLHD